MSNVNNNSAKIDVKIELDSNEYKASDTQNLTYTLVNNSNSPINVLKWHLPIDGIEDNIFKVKKSGEQEAVYLGIIVKRGLPVPEDYVTIDPKSSISTELDLNEFYDISQEGKYQVEFVSTILDFGSDEPETLISSLVETQKFSTEIIHSNVAEFKLVEDRKPKQVNGVAVEWIDKMKSLVSEGATSSFQNCSTSQTNNIKSALVEAEKYASKSKSILINTQESNRPQARRYKEWFGSYTSQRYDQVTKNYTKIHDALINKPIIFNCTCDRPNPTNIYAYVRPAFPYEIFLCNQFWNASITGTDSRAGTIVHELSHFYVVASTDDHEYGQVAARGLASNNPSSAIANADNHEYFAENTPPL
jgi:peptidyl-Lys metalloendopeptidase